VPIGEWFDSLRAGIGPVPPALIAIVLLGGPTAIWLLYRFVVQPNASRLRANERAGDVPMFWVCPECRSVNNIRRRWCYSCDAEPYEDELELIEAVPEEPGAPPPLIPVGPGKTEPQPWPRPLPVSSADDDEEWDDDWEEDDEEEDPAALPDVAAMTEVVESPRRRRSA
jgi:hypothetical protein